MGHAAVAIANVDSAAEIIAKTGYGDYAGGDFDEPQLVVFEPTQAPSTRGGSTTPEG